MDVEVLTTLTPTVTPSLALRFVHVHTMTSFEVNVWPDLNVGGLVLIFRRCHWKEQAEMTEEAPLEVTSRESLAHRWHHFG